MEQAVTLSAGAIIYGASIHPDLPSIYVPSLI